MSDEIETTLARKDEIPKHPAGGPGVFWLLIVVILISLALAITIFGKDRPLPVATPPITSNIGTDSGITQQEAKVYTVSYKNGVFSPTNLRIHSGDTVRFKNEGLFGIRIVSDFSGFDSVGDIPQGSYFSFTFAEKGIYGYHNNSNAKEVGSIIVR